MTNEIVTKSSRFYCVSVTPDICKTPVGASTPPLPYTIVGEFSDTANASSSVKSHSEPVILHQRSTVPTVKGDAAGSAGGVKSGTVGKQVETKVSSATHHANNANLVQVGREVWMNARNTVGKIYERGGEAARPLLDRLAVRVEEELLEARKELKPAAQAYQDDYAKPMHAIGTDLIDKGGRVAAVGVGAAATGAAISATGVGVIGGAPLAAAGTIGMAAGGVTASGGVALDSTASVLDHASTYILTGKTPDFQGMAVDLGTRVVEGLVANKLGPIGRWLGSKLKALGGKALTKLAPGKRAVGPAKVRTNPPEKPPSKHDDDGKSRGKKEPKSEPPSECCPKDKGPANKRVKSKKPIHFGTGQEVLHQTDFVLTGAIPIDWIRTYRSGAETENWGMFGARWSSAFTTSVSLTAQGCVYHDESGRALRLPHLAPGQSHDNRKEAFVLARESTDGFTLTWRDGSRDIYARGTDGWLPHGYDGVNAMLAPTPPLRTERFVLVRSVARDGRGVSIEQWPAALPGAVLLRVVSDDGVAVEAIREESDRGIQSDPHGHPRIGRVEEVQTGDKRICHVRYQYAAGADDDHAALVSFPGPSYDLVRQTNLLGDARVYSYDCHLLTACTTYAGFKQTLAWVSLSSLRARWAGNMREVGWTDADYPITRENSYQARAICSRAADGSEGDGIVLDYVDIDTTRVSESGDVLEYSFNHDWLVSEVRRVTGAAVRSLGTRDWSRDGMLLADSDTAGHTSRYTYDGAGNLTSSTDAGGYVTCFDYDEANQPIAITDALGNTTRRTFDLNGRLASVTNALGHVTSYRYDGKGQLVEQIDAKGGCKRFDYDSAGQLRKFTDCSGNSTRCRYDERGLLVAIVELGADESEATRYTYDALGRLVALTLPDQTVERYVYDADSNLLVHTDALGHQTRYRYNGQGLPIERTDALGQTVHYFYDSALRLVQLANPKDERYLLAYDADGMLIAETGFDGKVTNYIYDRAGQLTASECLGRRTDLIHDVRGQLVAKLNGDGMVRYTYDALGRTVAVAAPQAENRFVYDAVGQVLQEHAAYYLDTLPAIPPVDGTRVAVAAFITTHEYDELGNRIRTTLPNGRLIDTLRYGSGHWHGTLWQGESIIDVERDERGRERRRRIGQGSDAHRMTATREYDQQSRLRLMTLNGPGGGVGGQPIRARRFAYDLVGNLLTVEQSGSAGDGLPGTFSHSYDPVAQLLSAIQPGLAEHFVFDPTGNLVQKTETWPAPDGDTVRELAVQTLSVAKVKADLMKAYGPFSYSYDEHGNVANKKFSEARHGLDSYNLGRL